MIEHVFGRDARIDAEILRQIAEAFAELFFLVQSVKRAEMDLAAIGLLQSGDGAHERRLTGAVRAEEAIHAARNGEGDVIEGADAVGIGFG